MKSEAAYLSTEYWIRILYKYCEYVKKSVFFSISHMLDARKLKTSL